MWPQEANTATRGQAWPRLATRGQTATRGYDFFPCFLLLEAARGFQNQEKSGNPEKGRPRVASRIRFRVHKTFTLGYPKPRIRPRPRVAWHRVQESALLIWLLFIRIAL